MIRSRRRSVTVDDTFILAATGSASDAVAGNTLQIDGDGDDTVTLADGSNWTAGTPSGGYTAYTHDISGAVALINTDITNVVTS